MSRRRKAVPPVEIKTNVPADLLAAVDLILWDPVLQKPKYGARSELITHLLRLWVKEKTNESGTPVADLATVMNEIQLAKEF